MNKLINESIKLGKLIIGNSFDTFFVKHKTENRQILRSVKLKNYKSILVNLKWLVIIALAKKLKKEYKSENVYLQILKISNRE